MEAGPAAKDIQDSIDGIISQLKQESAPLDPVKAGVPPEIIQQAGEGGLLQGPDGKQYKVQQGQLVPQ